MEEKAFLDDIRERWRTTMPTATQKWLDTYADAGQENLRKQRVTLYRPKEKSASA